MDLKFKKLYNSTMRRGIVLFLLSIFMLQNIVLAAPDVFQGHAEFDDTYGGKLDEKLYTGKTETLEKRNTIEMTVSQVLDGSFSFEGDEFFAEITADISRYYNSCWFCSVGN